HLRLVLSLLEAGVLPRGDRLEGVPRLLRAALLHRRAEHDRLRPAGRGAVCALGRPDAPRLYVRAEAGGQPAADRRGVRGTRAAARRPAGADARVAQERTRRGDARADPRLT